MRGSSNVNFQRGHLFIRGVAVPQSVSYKVLKLTFSRLELDDIVITFYNDINNQAVKIC